MNKQIEAIRAEIERLKEPYHPYLSEFENGCREGRNDVLDDILSFITSLPEEPNRPKSSDTLEEAAERQINETLFKWSYDDEDGIEQYVHDAFIAGAEWQKEQMLKDSVEAEVQYFGETQGVPRTIKIPRMQEWLKPFKDGDKVRIVVVKEDKQ